MAATSILTADPEGDERVSRGECACGCGVTLPTIRTWRGDQVTPGARWATSACRQRGYRRRLRLGAVATKSTRQQALNARKAARLLEAAVEADRQAAHLEACARTERARAEEARRQAAALDPATARRPDVKG